MLDEQIIGFAEVLQAGIGLDRQHEVSMGDLGGVVEAAHDFLVSSEFRVGHECVGDLGLAVAVRRQRTLHPRNHTDGMGGVRPEFARHSVHYALIPHRERLTDF